MKKNCKPFGNKSVAITIGKYSIQFRNLNEKQVTLVKQKYGNFCSLKGKKRLIVEVFFLENYLECNDYTIKREKDGFSLIFPYFMSQSDVEFKFNNLFLFDEQEYCFLYSLENTVRWLISNYSFQFGDFLLHSSSKVIGGKAFIFMGEHLAGKSTVVELLKEGFIIADDVVLIEKYDRDYYASKWPLELNISDFAYDEKFLIGAFFKLEKDLITSIKRLNRALSYAVFISSLPYIDIHELDYEVLNSIILKYPFYELRFEKKPFSLKELLEDD